MLNLKLGDHDTKPVSVKRIQNIYDSGLPHRCDGLEEPKNLFNKCYFCLVNINHGTNRSK